MIVLPPLKYTCTPYSLHVFFRLSLIPWVVGDHYVRLLDVTASIVVSCSIFVCGSSGFHFCFVYCPCRIFASFECFLQLLFSAFGRSSLEQMVLALCCNEPSTLYFDATVWLLSHWRYRSVWVGFLYTVVFKFPSLSGVIRTSRKGIEPSSPASSLVNWMCSSMLFRCLRNSDFWDDC